MFGPTGISAVNIGGTTIHSGLAIKQDPKLLGLPHKMKTSLTNRLSEVRMILFDELSMVSRDLFYQIHARLVEIFLCTVTIAFAELAVALLDDFLHLLPVRCKPIYACVDEIDKIDRLLSLNFRHIFQLADLTEVMRQKGDAEFINLLNKIRIGDIDADVQQKLKARFVNETADKYPQNAVHFFVENYPTVVHNKKILAILPD